jgi:2-dehydropantoate 2-reductase
MGCVCVLDVTFLDPGRVTLGPVGGLVLGRPRGLADAAVRDAAAMFQRGGMPAEATDDLAGARWTKLLVNLNNALPAATGRSIQALYEHPGVPAFVASVMREGVAVAKAEGARLAPIPWTSPALLRSLAILPPAVAGAVLRRRVRALFAGAPLWGSTLQSVRRGRPTEVDYLNGEVVRRGRARGVSTPRNAALVEAVHAVEQGRGFRAVPRLLQAR